MNWQLIICSLVQSFLLVCGQVTLKLALVRTPNFTFCWACIRDFLLNYWFLLCGIFFGSATVLWFYIIKHFPFSEAYPLTSLAYVFSLVAAIFIFHEYVGLQKWLGVLLILAGSYLLTRN